MSSAVERFAGVTKLLVGFVIAALVLAAVVMFINRGGKNTFTADFTNTNSIYKGSQIRILGVPVGNVKKIDPNGDVVRVTFTVKDDVKIPKDVKAVIVSPAIVGDRFIQLTPAYTGGATLAADAHLPNKQTAIPIELDQVFKAFDDLSVALGPEGANSDGSLSTLISGAADALDGQGAQTNATITNFAKLSTTLSDNSDELFGSMRQVETFVSMLKKNDATVRSFNKNTAGLASILADERQNLDATIVQLAGALQEVRVALEENRGSLHTNLQNLTTVTKTLSEHQAELADAWVAAPTALVNVAMAYNGRFGTLDARTNLINTLLGTVTSGAGLLDLLLGDAALGQLTDALAANNIDIGDIQLPIIGDLLRSAPNTDNSVSDMLGVQ